MTGLSDSFHRPINYFRISITDRCNLRCIYCMPETGINLLPHSDILSYEEIYTMAKLSTELGITKIRITGGEPLVRAGLPQLIHLLKGIEAIDDLSITTNGILLSDYALRLKQAGLDRVNVSLDTLKADRFEALTRTNHKLTDVLKGIETARKVGLKPVKINTVVIKDINDDEIIDFAQQTITHSWHVRFIELMPVTTNNKHSFVSVDEMRKCIESLGRLEPYLSNVGNGPAKYYRLPKARGTIGFIAPISEHFCFKCNRLRLTSNGKLRPCLLSTNEIDIKQALRQHIPDRELKHIISEAVANKPLQYKLENGLMPKDRPFSQVGG